MPTRYRIYISDEIRPYPAEYEISAAVLISEYLKEDVIFIKRSQNSKTADFRINNKIWELKSPIGDGKRTIQNNLRKADRQAANIILDLRRCKMRPIQAMNRVRFELMRANKIEHLIIIQKNEKIVALR